MSQIVRVIYVEDDPDIRMLTELALDGEGFELYSFSSGQEALDSAKDLQADLLLLDVMMPNMDGPSTLANLRKHEHIETVPAVFMTAKIQDSEINSYLDMGAIGVISKPFDPVTLPEQLQSLLEK